MVLRDLSYWGLVKANVVLTFALPLIFIPIVILISQIMQIPINLDTGSAGIKLLGFMTITTDGPLFVKLIFASIIWIINLIVATALLYALFQRTPLGSIRIGQPSAK